MIEPLLNNDAPHETNQRGTFFQFGPSKITGLELNSTFTIFFSSDMIDISALKKIVY